MSPLILSTNSRKFPILSLPCFPTKMGMSTDDFLPNDGLDRENKLGDFVLLIWLFNQARSYEKYIIKLSSDVFRILSIQSSIIPGHSVLILF